MCGIFGWQIKDNDIKNGKRFAVMASHLMINNDRRGGHSWGYHAPMKRKNKIVKGLGDISEAVDFEELCKNKFLMAHTRWASHGSVKIENAHPFDMGEVIGAHNGIISNHESLNFKYSRKFEVDSQHIFEHIQNGMDMRDINGYGAIEYVEKKNPQNFKLVKWNKGELAVYRLRSGNRRYGIIWSSSAVHLGEAMLLSGLDGDFIHIAPGTVHLVANGEIYDTKTVMDFGENVSSLRWNSNKLSAETGNAVSIPVTNTGTYKDPWDYDYEGDRGQPTLWDRFSHKVNLDCKY